MLFVNVDCGYCAKNSAMTFLWANDPTPYPDRNAQLNGSYYEEIEKQFNFYASVECGICKKVNFIDFYMRGDDFLEVQHSIKDPTSQHIKPEQFILINRFPNHIVFDNIEFWPNELQQPFKDVEAMVAEQKTPAFCLVNIRTILERAISDLTSHEGKLISKINKLRDEGVITEGMKDWAHSLRIDGNTGTHDFGGTIEEAKENLAFLRQFMHLCFTLPATIEAKKSIHSD